MKRWMVYLFGMLLILSGCGQKQEQETAGPPAGAGGQTEEQPFGLFLQTEAAGDAFTMTLTLKNSGSKNLALTFPTAQQADFVVTTMDGTELYRYSKGRMFTQQLTEVALSPGEEHSWKAVWSYEGNPPSASAYLVKASLLPIEMNGKKADKAMFIKEGTYKQEGDSSDVTVEGKAGSYTISGPAMPDVEKAVYVVEDGHNELVSATAIDMRQAWQIRIQIEKEKLPQNGTLLLVLQMKNKQGETKQQEFVLERFQ